MSGAEWAVFAAVGAGCATFLALVVWAIGKAGGWLRRKDGE